MIRLNYLEMLTRLGTGSAHPGGYSATLRLLERLKMEPGSSVLEAGCGTGRTACLLAKSGMRVTAVDVRKEMIDKARIRGEQEGVDVRFMVGDVQAMPLPDEQFDFVLVESVTNFVSAKRAMSEYYRLLKPGGTLADCEVIRSERHEAPDEVMQFFGFEQLLTAEQWSELLGRSGFSEYRVSDAAPMSELSLTQELQYPDELQIVSEGAWFDPNVWETSIQYTDTMHRAGHALYSAVLIAVK